MDTTTDQNVNFVKRSSRLHMEDDEVQFQNGGSLLGASTKSPSKWSKSKVLLLVTLIALFVMTMAMLLLLVDRRHYSPLWKGESRQPLSTSTIVPFTSSEPLSPSRTTAMASRWESFRLSTDLKPIHYDLKLKTFVEEDFFVGSVNITFRCLKVTDVVVLHQRDLSIEEDSIWLSERGQSEKVRLQSSPDSYLPYRLYIMHFQKYLDEDREYTLHIDFRGTFARDHVGIYRMQYPTKNGPRFAIASFLSPMAARKVFPCFDEPAFKANFSVTIVHPSQYRALSNMPESDPRAIGDGYWLETEFQMTPPMSTYLLSFAVTTFEAEVKLLPNGVELRVWSRAEVISNVTYAAREAERLFLFLEQYSGFKYPLPKLDLIALPEHLPAGMENWGLITFRENILFVDEEKSATVDIQDSYFVIAHELSHQWYSNLVTQSFWDELWLKECFASLFGYMALDAVHPTWNKLAEQSLTDNMLIVMKLDAMGSSHPILREITEPSQVMDNFDTVIYWKSTAVVRMLLGLIGEETFKIGMQRFLQDRAYQNADAEDIWNAMDAVTDSNDIGIHISDLMRPWLQQSGYPLIHVTSDPVKGKVTVDQSPFLLDERVRDQLPPSPYDYRWDVPLTFVTSSQPNWTSPQARVLRRSADSPTELNINGYNADDWIIVNANRTGYYRVLYDEENRNRLIAQLETNHEAIPPPSRASLIDDAFNLATAGFIKYSELFRFTKYMSKERHHLPWTLLLNNFDYITNMLQMTSAYGVFQDYMLQLIGPVFDESLNSTAENVTAPQRLLRECILRAACKYGYHKCILLAKEEYNKEIRKEISIHPDFEKAIRSSAMTDPESRDFAFDLLRESGSRDESFRILESLSSSPEPWVLSSVLEMSMNTSVVKYSEGADLIKSVYANPIGRNLAWNFFRSEWDTLRDRYAGGLFRMGDIISGVTMWFNTEFQLQELQTFISSISSDLRGAAGLTSFYQAIDNTQANIQWMDTNYGAVKAWLDHNVD